MEVQIFQISTWSGKTTRLKVMWLYVIGTPQDKLQSGKFGGNRHYSIGDIMVLTYRINLQNPVAKDPSNFTGGSPSI